VSTIITFKQLIDEALVKFAVENPAHPKGLYEPVNYTLSLGGKRMRPLLVLMGNDLFGGKAGDALSAAIAIELFHNFTLVHDDIMDNASLRRGKPTVHEKWDRNTAVLSGDVMLVAAYAELAKADPEKLPQLLRIFNRTAAQVCEGQQLDMDFEKQKNVALEEYLHMIELKTAVLLGASLEMGAVCAGAKNEDAAMLDKFGKGIGLAFQLKDDVLDVYGDAPVFGKTKGGDIVSNKKTWLLIKALELASPLQKKEIYRWMDDAAADPAKKIGAICTIYDELKVADLTQQEMTKHFELAMNNLNALAMDKEKKKGLTGLAAELFDRKH
jgi:geranylgeranyl diphosphate synthase type II